MAKMSYMVEMERYKAANADKEPKTSKRRRRGSKKTQKKGPDDTISSHSDNEKASKPNLPAVAVAEDAKAFIESSNRSRR
jgi:hypothetical protein